MELEELLRNGLTAEGVAFDETALERFRVYYEYLEETNKVMNLTAISGETDVANLHFLDCAALLNIADTSGKRVLDVGTGAGFPGMVLKILRPDTELMLLDGLDKRIRFLEACCEKLGLDGVKCVHGRAEEIPDGCRQHFDLVTSRAVARLSTLAELCLPYVKRNGLFIAMKSTDSDAEIEEAKKCIAILGGKVEKICDYAIPGTDVVHRAVVIRKIKDTPPKYPRKWAQIKKSPL